MAGSSRHFAIEEISPLLRGNSVQLNDREKNVPSKVLGQWMKLSGFRKDPATGEWETRGGPRPEGVKNIVCSHLSVHDQTGSGWRAVCDEN
jgi:hypothetical protein